MPYNDDGRAPEMLFLDMSRLWRCVSSPMTGGRAPEIPKLARASPTTCSRRLLHVTPVKLQTWALDSFQSARAGCDDRLSPRFRANRVAFSRSRTCRRRRMAVLGSADVDVVRKVAIWRRTKRSIAVRFKSMLGSTLIVPWT